MAGRSGHRLLAAALLAGLVPTAAMPAPPADASTAPWIAELRKAVQLAPQQGEQLAIAAEAKARQLPPGEDRDLRILTAQYFRAEALLQQNKANAASPIVDRALQSVPASAAGTKLKGQLLLVRAGILSSQGRSPAALADYQAAYRIFIATRQPRYQAVSLMGIGSIYQDAGDYQRVLYYYGLADELQTGDAMLGLSSANNEGNALAELKAYNQAEARYRTALGFAAKLHSPVLEARILRNIAQMEMRSGRVAAADATIQRALAMADNPGGVTWRPLILGTAAELKMIQKRPAEAVRLIEAAVSGLSRAELGDQSYRDLHRIAYQAYKAVGDDRHAIDHLETFRSLDEEGRALVTQASASLLGARFDFANQNARISTLKAGQLQRDIELARLQVRQNAITLGGLLALVTLIAAGLAIYLRILRRSRDSIQTANEALSLANSQLGHALSAKSRFLATTSHEIRTPLNGVLGMTQVLLANPAVTGDVRQRIALVQGAGETMRRLVDDILESAKIDAGNIVVERDRLDLHALLDESVRFWMTQATIKSLAFALDLGSSPRYIVEDGRRLRQILYNLLSNALKFTSTGSVLVSAEVAGSEDESLIIKIADTGVGIPEDALGSIFEMFSQVDTSTTRQYGGTGLGLAISRSIARALGGDIVVASDPGRGSTFTVTLPLHRDDQDVGHEPETVSSRADALVEARVLMIGGTPIAQRVLRNVVGAAAAGFDVIELEAVSRGQAPLDKYDILLIDAATVDASAVLDGVTKPLHPVSRPKVAVLLAEGGFPDSLPDVDVFISRPLTPVALLAALNGLFVVAGSHEALAPTHVIRNSAAHAP